MKETKEEAINFINNGGKAVYCFGLWNKCGKEISKEEALEKLSHSGWDFGTGFYELHWIFINGQTVLQFKELHENDLW